MKWLMDKLFKLKPITLNIVELLVTIGMFVYVAYATNNIWILFGFVPIVILRDIINSVRHSQMSLKTATKEIEKTIKEVVAIKDKEIEKIYNTIRSSDER